MKTIRLAHLVLLLVSAMLVGACSEQSTAPGTEAEPATSPRPADSPQTAEQPAPASDLVAPASDWIEQAKQAVTQYQLTTLPLEQLSFELLDDDQSGERRVVVREKHTPESGGDPSTAPRLFSLAFDVATGKVSTDARGLPGEFEPL